MTTRNRMLAVQAKRLAAVLQARDAFGRPVPPTITGRTVVVNLKAGTVLPTPRPTTTPHVQQWSALVKHWVQYVPAPTNPAAPDEDQGTIRCQRHALYCTTSGGPDCLPNHYRIWRSTRNGTTVLSLASSMTGTDGTWVRTNALTPAEVHAWLAPRIGTTQATALLADLLS